MSEIWGCHDNEDVNCDLCGYRYFTGTITSTFILRSVPDRSHIIIHYVSNVNKDTSNSVTFEFCDEENSGKLTCFRLLKLQKRVFMASIALSHFTTRSWEFNNDKMFWLREQILPCDKKAFGLDDIEYTDDKEFYMASKKGATVYLLKECADETRARKHYTR